MAFTTYVHADIQLFFGESFTEAFAAVHFSRDEMMKGQRYHPAAAGAGRYRGLFAHSVRLLSAYGHFVD